VTTVFRLLRARGEIFLATDCLGLLRTVLGPRTGTDCHGLFWGHGLSRTFTDCFGVTDCHGLSRTFLWPRTVTDFFCIGLARTLRTFFCIGLARTGTDFFLHRAGTDWYGLFWGLRTFTDSFYEAGLNVEGRGCGSPLPCRGGVGGGVSIFLDLSELSKLVTPPPAPPLQGRGEARNAKQQLLANHMPSCGTSADKVLKVLKVRSQKKVRVRLCKSDAEKVRESP
jgi:hypothetical protein